MADSTEPETTRPPRQSVLFLCTGNSARSQIAESLVNHYLGDRWEAHSAGTAPAGYVHPLAVQVLREWGVEFDSLRSKSVDEFRGQAFDFVIALCDEANEHCPPWLGPDRLRHLRFPDPARAPGSPAERLDVFRQVRDAIWLAVQEQLRTGSRSPAPLTAS